MRAPAGPGALREDTPRACPPLTKGRSTHRGLRGGAAPGATAPARPAAGGACTRTKWPSRPCAPRAGAPAGTHGGCPGGARAAGNAPQSDAARLHPTAARARCAYGLRPARAAAGSHAGPRAGPRAGPPGRPAARRVRGQGPCARPRDPPRTGTGPGAGAPGPGLGRACCGTRRLARPTRYREPGVAAPRGSRRGAGALMPSAAGAAWTTQAGPAGTPEPSLHNNFVNTLQRTEQDCYEPAPR